MVRELSAALTAVARSGHPHCRMPRLVTKQRTDTLRHDKLSRGRIHPISVCVPIFLLVELFGLNPIVSGKEVE